ncbi:DUF4124 domain-containing protein [Pseudomonas luteola]|uniref:DUF4124 domain-containing protein n=1 Tax=Pseudomonas TaxID=286 RepID=UPI0038907BF9
MRLLFASLVFAMTLPVHAEIYRSVGPNGQTVFSDQPPANAPAERVELQRPNTVKAETPASTAPSPSPPDTGAATSQPYQTLRLDAPDDEALRANNGTFSISATITPALSPGHELRLLVDGQPYGEPTRAPFFHLTNIDRGTHSLAIEVVESTRVVQQSEPVEITVQRISLNSPSR